jgi:hypothetical protein
VDLLSEATVVIGAVIGARITVYSREGTNKNEPGWEYRLQTRGQMGSTTGT